MKLASKETSRTRPMQNKKVAFWFYRVLSLVYDKRCTGVAWTEEIRDAALKRANLCHRKLKVLDVGGGTGYSTEGIVKHVDPENVIVLDQSTHQLQKAREKEALKKCTIIQGDAENLPFPTDYADRYISAGCIEYWPEPQRGVNEAYRVLQPGGLACIIGPLYPTFWLSRYFADLWMLFPKREDYVSWFKNAGFEDIKVEIEPPKWFGGSLEHGVIMGCWVTGVKKKAGQSPMQLGDKSDVIEPPGNALSFLSRMIPGLIAAAYFVLMSNYMWIKTVIFPKSANF